MIPADTLTATPGDAALADVRDRALLRWFLVGCQAVSILVTWPLWQVRSGATSPPNLPLFGLTTLEHMQIPVGELLLLTLVAALLWPRAGTIAHGLTLATALALDQLRIQPEFVSLAILLAGTLPRRGALLLARCHLISLWLFAGLHKLLSSGYLWETGPQLAQGLLAGLTDHQAFLVATAMAAAEVTLAAVAIHPMSRRSVPPMAAIVHGGILFALLMRQWNTAVWPWNLALAVAGYGFFAGWNELLWAGFTRGPWQTRLWQAAAALMLCYPALYYLNLCDGYLAWCVYSANTPEATIYDRQSPEGERLFYRVYRPLNVPFSPAVRLFEQHFRRTAQPGDRLEIDDPRPLARWLGRQKRTVRATRPENAAPP